MEDVEEIKRYGDAAVPVLADYLRSGGELERSLAVEFLGLLGGSRIIEPLRIVIQSDTSPSIREKALRWLAQAPWDLAAPIITEAGDANSDANVRKVARDILTKRAHK